MNKSVLIIMGGALVVAVIVAMVVQSRLAPKAAPVKASTAEVLVANKLIMIGEKLKSENVRWQAWPDDALFKGIIKKSDQPDPAKLAVYDSPLRRNIESGEPVTTTSLISDTKGVFLSALISPNMRAASIAIGVNTGAGGFIAPGDRVDVILTYTPKITGPAQEFVPQLVQRYASQVILSNIKVLGIDQNSTDDKHEAKVGKTATLEVSLEDAQKLALAEQMGTLSLFLRRLGENDNPNAPPPKMVTDVTTSDVIKKAKDMADESKSIQKTTSVRMYSGNNVQNIPVRQTPEQ